MGIFYLNDNVNEKGSHIIVQHIFNLEFLILIVINYCLIPRLIPAMSPNLINFKNVNNSVFLAGNRAHTMSYNNSEWLLLKWSEIDLPFNGAETNCKVARILGVLLMTNY